MTACAIYNYRWTTLTVAAAERRVLRQMELYISVEVQFERNASTLK